MDREISLWHHERRFGNVSVHIDALPEYDVDLSWDETGEVAEKIDSGELVVFCAKVTVCFKGMDGDDYLGHCIERNYEDFLESGYYRDMVSEAIGHLKTKVIFATRIGKELRL